MASALDVELVVQVLEGHRFAWAKEAELHETLFQVLSKRFQVQREVELFPGSRIDFMIGDIGLEVKIKGSLAEVTRQLHRYACIDRVGSLVLVSTLLKLAGVPRIMNRKPVSVAYIGSYGV